MPLLYAAAIRHFDAHDMPLLLMLTMLVTLLIRAAACCFRQSHAAYAFTPHAMARLRAFRFSSLRRRLLRRHDAFALFSAYAISGGMLLRCHAVSARARYATR